MKASNLNSNNIDNRLLRKVFSRILTINILARKKTALWQSQSAVFVPVYYTIAVKASLSIPQTGQTQSSGMSSVSKRTSGTHRTFFFVAIIIRSP
jgi:hypothetical protein